MSEAAVGMGRRQAAADAAFMGYDFGGAVEATDGWASETPGWSMTRCVYIEDPETDEGPSIRCWFTVMFEDETSDVIAEVYAINEKGNLFGRPGPDAALAGSCPECGEADCPGLVTCPVCGTDDHGAEASTMLADHGRCWSCHKGWQLGEEDAA